MNTQTAIILLAAGNSSRMGTPKQMLDFRGKPLLRHCTDIALGANCGPVVIVLGSRLQEVAATLSGLPVEIAVNNQWEQGIGTSIQAGLHAVIRRNLGGAILMLADQPFVKTEFLRRLILRHVETKKRIVASQYSGAVGVPVFFARDAFPLLARLAPDQGCKSVLFENRNDASFEDCHEAAIDIDTPEDYARNL